MLLQAARQTRQPADKCFTEFIKQQIKEKKIPVSKLQVAVQEEQD